jgi:predicted anti-sigma-YlaC factor YlaD
MGDLKADINCRGVVEIVTDYLEGAMSPGDVQIVDRHLATCDGCRRYLDQMRSTIATLGRLRDDDVPEEMRESLIAAFREIMPR